jgi:hypothetical protein
MRPPKQLMLTECSTFFFIDRTGGKSGEAILPVGLIERGWVELSELSHGFFQGSFVLNGDDNQ